MGKHSDLDTPNDCPLCAADTDDLLTLLDYILEQLIAAGHTAEVAALAAKYLTN
jgi:hypothetical protein